MAGLSRRDGRSGAIVVLVRAGIVMTIWLGLFVSFADPVAAQGFGWFGNLFGVPHNAPPPRYPGYGRGPDFYDDRQPRRAPRRRQADTARSARDKDVASRPPSKTASTFVYVFGDSLGQSLASGLDDSLADRPDVATVHKAKGSTGLVAADFYDWPKIIEDLVARQGQAKVKAKPEQAKPEQAKQEQAKQEQAKQETDKAGVDTADSGKIEPDRIDVAVMMIGSNDRQAIRDHGKLIERGTPDWTAAYRKRVLAIDEAFLKKGIPLVWVGVPITRDDDFADDMAAFNEIYRDAAAKTGAVYVDSWEAFSDDDGDFRADGPDINGQIVRLRTADGVYFTKAGGRKLAHFVEAHVRRALDGKTQMQPLLLQPTPRAPPLIGKPDIGPVSNLNDPPIAHDGLLASVSGRKADALVETTIVKGQAQAARAGRADDLRWPSGN